MTMSTVAVFDSGLGSLSVVRELRKISDCDIIYYADTASHPYGLRDICDIRRIICGTIRGIKERFAPDVIVVGSITPTLLLDDMESGEVVGVWPPICEAYKMSHTVTALVTRVVMQNGSMYRYASSKGVHIRETDATALIHMVESGKFLQNPPICDMLDGVEGACILGSTHLSFLYDMMTSARPEVTFVDPVPYAAERVARMVCGGDSTLQVYSSGDIRPMLRRLGVREPVMRANLCDTRG